MDKKIKKNEKDEESSPSRKRTPHRGLSRLGLEEGPK
jgi:hypothetical protein